jgi:lipoprotein-anchoring transpeptidase ErfK/SrfK
VRLIAVAVAVCWVVVGVTLVRSSITLPPQPAVVDSPQTTPSPPLLVLPLVRRAHNGNPHRPPRFCIVRLGSPTRVARWPNGPTKGTLADHTSLGSPVWLWVISRSHAGRWLRVLLPWLPNDSTGWIRLGHRIMRTTRVVLDADLSQRRLRLMRRGRPIVAFRTAIGSPESPTPTGRFSVTDRISTGDPSSPFGWYAFGLSGHQPQLPPGWAGGNQLAIHGTNQPSSIGSAVSAGCLRVSARALWILRKYVLLGTPVVIHQ